MKKVIYSVLILVSMFFYTSCKKNPVATSVPSDIQIFVDGLELEDAQNIEIIIEVKSKDVYVFSVAYGPPQDCPSGCFYSTIWGLKNETKISLFENYNIEPQDTYLFSQEFLDLVKEKDDTGIYYTKLLPLLAKDEDTPRGVLFSIAQILYNYISPQIAYNLLENLVVKNDLEILTLLSELPVFQGDAYENIRNIALDLLNKL